MPEGPEVEKLRRQLNLAWSERVIMKFTAPANSPNPRKYYQGDWADFRQDVEHKRIDRVGAYGKHLLVVTTDSTLWQIHLSSTGWWMPGNSKATELATVDPIVDNFLHSVNEKNVRVRMHLSDGQIWNYHDSRTWGKWWSRAGWQGVPLDPYLKKLGPEWISNTGLKPASLTLKAYNTNSNRTIKEVLCDQEITAGLGNYLACEACFIAKLHPHRLWESLSAFEKESLVIAVGACVQRALVFSDHEHWFVFDRRGEFCKNPDHPPQYISYAKDRGGARGSYFCPACQPETL